MQRSVRHDAKGRPAPHAASNVNLCRRVLLDSVLLLLPLGFSAGAHQNTRLPPASQHAKKTIAAVRAEGPLTLDGSLDEPVWSVAEAATDFVQREPQQGLPATDRTEVRVAYDTKAIYFGVVAYDSEPQRLIINSLEQDFGHTGEDVVAIYLDTFNDDRNAFVFYFNPVGAKKEMQSVDEGRDLNIAWEDVWDVKTRITADGWLAEVRIPFKSLRFPRLREQRWGLNFQRLVRRKNEQSDWSPIPRRFNGYYLSFAGDLDGLENVRPGRNFKVKPFVTAGLNRVTADKLETKGDAGLDLKYGITPGVTLDVSINTDFSNVEVDEQQVNLTRFSLFFPEKRDFFLENSGLFNFGRAGGTDREVIPFFSRRIGLARDLRPLPVLAGVRLTGRAGNFNVGFLNMQTRESGPDPATNFSVLRIKRNILSRSEVGLLWINRQSDQPGDYNRTFGVDSSFRLMQNLQVNSFLTATRTDHLSGDSMAGRILAEWRTNRYEVRSSYLDIGKNFNPEVGFVQRVDIRKSDSSAGWRLRPLNRQVRELFPNVRLEYVTDHENRLLTRVVDLEFRTEFHGGGTVAGGRSLNFERQDAPFSIQRIRIAPGDYHFNHWYADIRSNPSSRLTGQVRIEKGDFWDGSRKGLLLTVGYRPNYRLSVTGRYQMNRLDLKAGQATSHLLNMRFNYSFNTRTFFNALIQYNSDLRQVSSNLRFNLIHRPLSDIFVVYNERRDLFHGGSVDRSLTLKYTHMLDLF